MLLCSFSNLNTIAKMGNEMPHLMFVGISQRRCKDAAQTLLSLMKRSLTENDVLTVQCEERGGISTVRDLLRPFSKCTAVGSPSLILLLRFDKLSYEAQYALRRTMEIEQSRCRYIATTSSIENVINPIRSRFVLLNAEPEQWQLEPRQQFCDELKTITNLTPTFNNAKNLYLNGYLAIDILKKTSKRELIPFKNRLQLLTDHISATVQNETIAIYCVLLAIDSSMRHKQPIGFGSFI